MVYESIHYVEGGITMVPDSKVNWITPLDVFTAYAVVAKEKGIPPYFVRDIRGINGFFSRYNRKEPIKELHQSNFRSGYNRYSEVNSALNSSKLALITNNSSNKIIRPFYNARGLLIPRECEKIVHDKITGEPKSVSHIMSPLENLDEETCELAIEIGREFGFGNERTDFRGFACDRAGNLLACYKA